MRVSSFPSFPFPPVPSLKITTRIFIKALVLLLLLNFICVALNFNPITAVTRLNLWGLVGHGRERLIYPSDLANGQLSVDSLIGAHTLAYTPKSADEYRVVVLGESGIAGWGLHDEDTFVRQLNARQLHIQDKGGDKRLVAYNLAYPSPNVARDVLILDAARAYHPDLFIWFVTPAALDDSSDKLGTNVVFFDLNRQRLQRITNDYGLTSWFTARMSPEQWWSSLVAIHGQDALPVWFNSLLYPFTAPDYGITNHHIGFEAIPAQARYRSDTPGFDPIPNPTWQFLAIGRDLAAKADAQLLLVNEPMLIGQGANSDVNYNKEYEKAFYDRYHQQMTDYAAQKGFWFADVWNLIPLEAFTDTPLHANAAGYAKLVDRMATVLTGGSN